MLNQIQRLVALPLRIEPCIKVMDGLHRRLDVFGGLRQRHGFFFGAMNELVASFGTFDQRVPMRRTLAQVGFQHISRPNREAVQSPPLHNDLCNHCA